MLRTFFASFVPIKLKLKLFHKFCQFFVTNFLFKNILSVNASDYPKQYCKYPQ